MPELPEVEITRRGLAPVLESRPLADVDARRPDLRFPLPARFAARLRGRRIERLGRRGKYLLGHLDDETVLVMHLGMSGRFTIHEGRPDHFDRHDHVIFDTGRNTIVYRDPRRFGFMDLIPEPALETHPFFRHLGPDPLSNGFNALGLSDSLRGRRTPIKAALLDQRTVAGLGNIYISEALFRAGISPRRSARTIAGKRAARLAPAIKQVLDEAIAAGGSSLRDYAQTSGELGYFQHRFAVYARENERCPRPGCAGVIRRIVQAGRSSYYCPGHQR